MTRQRVTLIHMPTDTITIQQPGADEQRVDIYTTEYDHLIHVEVADDEDGSHIELHLSTSEAERLIAALSVQVAMARLAAA